MVDGSTSTGNNSNRIAAIVTEVLGPALAIAAVASIAFFLIDIFCSGPFVDRCKWIFFLFSFAAVLVSRISIKEGYQHAAIYGLFLAFATLLVSSRFMQGNIISLGLILAFVWWCAGRLTWDCTFIDATRDATGQGMIDLAIDRATHHRKKEAGNEATSSGPAENIVVLRESETTWKRIQRILFSRRQPNTPGLWAFYFLIGGLPFFGLGQMLIPVRDVARHNSVSMQVLVYFVGVFGLLLVSSVTGLHRYLMRNNAQLPHRIAVRWLITGCIMAILITLICWLLPRPTPDWSLARLIPSHVKTSRISMGQDGQEQSDKNANLDSGPQANDRQPEKENTGQGKSGNQKTGGKGDPVDQDNAKQENGQSERKSQSGGKDSDDSGSSRGKQNEQSNADPENGESNSSAESDSDKGKGQSPDESSDRAGESANKSDNAGADKEGESRNNDAKKSDDQSRDQQEPERQQNRRSGRDRQSAIPNSGQQEMNEDIMGDDESEENEQLENRNSSGGSQAKHLEQSGSLVSQAGQIVKLLIGFIAAVVVAWFGLKHRDRLLPWFQSFLQELREFWNRLFNRNPKKAATATAVEVTPARAAGSTLPGFMQFQNPFADGTVNHWSPEKTVRYTFEAFEAWSRDQQCSREPEQTVLEFAQSTGKQFQPLASDVLQLATLYSQIAYAGATVPQAAAMTLSGLWDKLTSLYQARA